MPDERRDSGLKWRRGSEHFEWLEDAWNKYTSNFRSELDFIPISGGVEIRLGNLSEPPQREWSLVLGDCVQNLRSALDYMVWQLASANARQNNSASLEFPIFSESAKYAQGAPSRIASLAAAAQNIVESVQPFHNRDGYVGDPLWQLYALSNIDKHRRLHVGDVSLEAVTFDVKGSRLQTDWQAAPPAVRARRGMALARIAEAEMRRFGERWSFQVQPSAVLTVAFQESEDITREGVIGTLRSIRDRVGDVLDQLDPFIAII